MLYLYSHSVGDGLTDGETLGLADGERLTDGEILGLTEMEKLGLTELMVRH